MAVVLRCMLLLLMLLGSSAADLYKTLGIEKNSSQQEIKKAFHKLSLKYHPDKNPSKSAQSKFSQISNAYEILSDEEKRKHYDLTGDPSGQGGFQGSQPGSGFPGGFGGFPGGQTRNQQRTYHYNFQGGQNFQGWSDPGQYWAEYKTKKKDASAESGWGGFNFPSFGNGASSPGAFAGDIFDSLFGAAMKGFKGYRDSFGSSKAEQASGKQSQTEFSKLVEQINSEQFQQKVLERQRQMWVILFYSPVGTGELNEKVVILNQVAHNLLGILKVGAVNCQLQGKLCSERAPSTLQTRTPSLYIYPYGTDGKSSHSQYKGLWTDRVEDYILKQIPNLSTRVDNQKVIGHLAKLRDVPQAVLFSKKKETSAKWRALSCVFEKRIEFYDVHVDSNMDPLVAQKFGIQSYPSVVGVLGNGEDYVLAGQKIFDLTGHKMMQELTNFLENLEIQSKVAGVGKSGAEGDVPTLTKANSAVVCGSDTPLCVIAAVDYKKGGAKAKQILSELSHKTLVRKVQSFETKKPSVSYSLVDLSNQASFVHSFESGKVQGKEILLIAYKPRKKKFAVHKGLPSLEDAEAFVAAALGGDLTFQTLSQDPVLL